MKTEPMFGVPVRALASAGRQGALRLACFASRQRLSRIGGNERAESPLDGPRGGLAHSAHAPGAMKVRIGPFMIVAVVLGAAGLSMLHAEGPREPKSEAASTPAVVDDTPTAPLLPPDHPPIDGRGSPHGMQNAMQSGMTAMQNPMGPTVDEAPAITWKVPPTWQTGTNPNAMRIATYHPSPDTDVSVSRAGGSSDANIERWIGQFDDAGQDKRTEKTVRGLDVKLVEVSGTYVGGGMMPAAAAEPHGGWMLVGAVVETAGSHYFFKLLGPAAQVRAARPSFDSLIASLAPSRS